MRNVKQSLKAFGLLLLAAIGVMSFMAAGASAVTWDLEGVPIAAHASVGGALKAPVGRLVTHNSGVEIECQELVVDNGLLIPNANAHATLLYLKCHTFQKGASVPSCNLATVLPVAVKIKPILHPANNVMLLVSPLTAGTNFTSVHFPAGCALPLTNITGSIVFECLESAGGPRRSCAVNAPNQLIKSVSEALNKALGDEIKYGLNFTLLTGEIEIFGTGADAGKGIGALAH